MWPVVYFICPLSPQGPTKFHFQVGEWCITEAKGLLAKESEVAGIQSWLWLGEEATGSLQLAPSFCAQNRQLTIVRRRASFFAAFGKLTKPTFTGYASVLSLFSAGVCPVLSPSTIIGDYLL